MGKRSHQSLRLSSSQIFKGKRVIRSLMTSTT